MANSHTPEQIEQLKRNISILHICADHGIELKRHGTQDHIGICPFHDDEEPSFIVTPGKNLWHCMGCDKGGSVIDLVMQLDGLTFREAIDKLMTSNGLISRGSVSSTGGSASGGKQKDTEDPPTIPPARAAQLLERVVELYAKTFAEAPSGRQYLESRGIADAGLFTQHRIGYANPPSPGYGETGGTLTGILPKDGQLKEELKALGILLADGRERFTDCVIFPVFDSEGQLVTLCGRHTKTRKHIFLPDRPKGLWNEAVAKTYPDLILVESVLDALSLIVAGHPNVIALHGTNPGAAALDSLAACGTQSITLLLDGDKAGQQAAERLSERITWAHCTTKRLPDDHDPNSYLTAHGAEKLHTFLAEESGNEPGEVPAIASKSGRTPTLTLGRRRYEIHGLEKGPRKLKVTVRIDFAGRLHVDTLDLYSARARRTLSQDLCRIFEETPETIEADITKLLKHCESLPGHQESGTSDQESAKPTLSPQETAEAEAFGKSPDLIEKILTDMETCGLVGEEANKLLCYLAVTSRKMDEPLSVLVLSSSGSGKTALQDAASAFCPPEDLLKLTSLSGKALFYKDALSLKHKVLALEEGAGADEASYAIRNLISSGVLIVEAAIKDPATGKITTMTNKVEGPTTVLLTTTNPNTDPETKSRFFVTSIDESREQTRAIMLFQRKRETLDGLAGRQRLDAVAKRQHNFQRLLKPVCVINPMGDQLAYGDDRLQGRRDQPKYLRLIRAVAFLRQLQKPVKTHQVDGSVVEYIEADAEDIRLANKLAHEILGGSLDELSRPSRALLMDLENMVRESVGSSEQADSTEEPHLNRVSFTRREIREFTGWSNYRVHTHLRELIELEYVSTESDRVTNGHRYRLLWDGQGKDGRKFMLGLIDG